MWMLSPAAHAAPRLDDASCMSNTFGGESTFTCTGHPHLSPEMLGLAIAVGVVAVLCLASLVVHLVRRRR